MRIMQSNKLSPTSLNAPHPASLAIRFVKSTLTRALGANMRGWSLSLNVIGFFATLTMAMSFRKLTGLYCSWTFTSDGPWNRKRKIIEKDFDMTSDIENSTMQFVNLQPSLRIQRHRARNWEFHRERQRIQNSWSNVPQTGHIFVTRSNRCTVSLLLILSWRRVALESWTEIQSSKNFNFA